MALNQTPGSAAQNWFKSLEMKSVQAGGDTSTASRGPPKPAPTMAYLKELMHDKDQLFKLIQGGPSTESPDNSPASTDGKVPDKPQDITALQHLNTLLDYEVERVKRGLPKDMLTEEPLVDLPEPVGQMVTLKERMYVPVKEYPDYNFAGRILGPRGMTVKQLEQTTGCRILVQGRQKKLTSMDGGPPMSDGSKLDSGDNTQNEDLHVLVVAEDTENRVHLKMQRAKRAIEKILYPTGGGMDELKKKQLMELAIINGTYRQPASQTHTQTGFVGQAQPNILFKNPGNWNRAETSPGSHATMLTTTPQLTPIQLHQQPVIPQQPAAQPQAQQYIQYAYYTPGGEVVTYYAPASNNMGMYQTVPSTTGFFPVGNAAAATASPTAAATAVAVTNAATFNGAALASAGSYHVSDKYAGMRPVYSPVAMMPTAAEMFVQQQPAPPGTMPLVNMAASAQRMQQPRTTTYSMAGGRGMSMDGGHMDQGR